MKFRFIVAMLLLAASLVAQDKPIIKPGAVILDEDYSKPDAAGKWTTVGGHWTIKDGVLMGTVGGRKSPALVYPRRYHDVLLTTRFKLVDNICMIVRFEGWHGAQSVGLVIYRDSILAQKLQARDDAHTEKGKFVDLGRATQKIDAGRWYELTVSIVGDELKASIEGGGSVSVKNPGFDVDHSEVAVVFSGGVGFLSKLKAVVPGQ